MLYIIYVLYIIRRYHISNLDMTQRVPSTQALSEEKFERIQSLLVIKEWQLYISQNMSKIQVDILSGLFLCHFKNMSQIWEIFNCLIDRKDNKSFCSDHHYYHQDHLHDIKIICVQVVIQLLLALQAFGSPVELLSQLPEDPIDPPNGMMLMITRINARGPNCSGHNDEMR